MIGALVFDVFGTVVDWRTSVVRHALPPACTRALPAQPVGDFHSPALARALGA